MSDATIGPPTLAGFNWFLTNIVGVPSADQASTQAVNFVYALAVSRVNIAIQQAAPADYTVAVYNLATDLLINVAVDQSGQTFWKNLRASFNTTPFRGGVISAAADESTSGGVEVIEALKNLTLLDLQNLKTPYGQTYLGIAMQYGSVWVMS